MREKTKVTWSGAAALAVALALAVPASAAVEQGDKAPAWTAHDFAGRTVEFPAVAQGKPTILIFWATWCPYCRAFMPYLKNIEADYAKQGVKVVAIDVKEDGRADPKAYVQGLGFKPIAIADGDGVMQAYGIRFIPGLLIVDGKGQVAYKRPWTDLPAGQTVAELWDGQVRGALNALVRK
jgi:thiol-disulfide isomerase/thioredoxin